MNLREGVAVGFAILAHLSFYGGARWLPSGNVLLERARSDRGQPIDAWVEIENDPGPARDRKIEPAPREEEQPPAEKVIAPAASLERSTPADKQPRAATRADRAADADPSRADPAQPDSAGAPPDAAAPGAAAPRAPSDEYSDPSEDSPFPSLAGLLPTQRGLGVAAQIALDGASGTAAPTEAPAAAPVSKDAANDALARSLRGKDKALGIDLPATGIVVGTVASATRSVPVPHGTRASFEVQLGPGGKVLGVRVASSSGGDAAAWQGAAKTIAAQLAKQSLSLGEASKSGALIRVGVTVKHVYPAGTSKAADVKPVCANQIINDLADAAQNKPSATPESTIPLFQDENGRPCIPIGMAGVSDASNLGATKQIQVLTTSTVLVGGKEALPDDIRKVDKSAPWAVKDKAAPRPNAPQKLRKYQRDREKKK